MPTIRKVPLGGGQAVPERLHAAAVDLLPKAMVEHPVANWVLDHDSLNKWREGNRESDDLDELEVDGMAAVVGRLVAFHLQQRLSFYFASLFHIGRMQAVGGYCRENVQRLSLRENLAPSTRNLAALLEAEPGGSGEQLLDQAERILRNLATAATEHSSVQRRLAADWWTLWVREAGALRDAANQFDEALRRTEGRRLHWGGAKLAGLAMRMMLLCQSPSALSSAMKQAGVRLKPAAAEHPSDPVAFPGLAALFIALAAFADGEGFMEHAFMHWEHMLHTWIREEQERRRRPQVDIALDVLRQKCGAGNPFDEHLPLCGAPTPELRALVREHELPNHEVSPWRAIWEAHLDEEYDGGSHLCPPDSTEAQAVDWAVRAADSAIRRHVTEKITPTETWGDFVQRLYEDYVVERLGQGAGRANKDASEEGTVWSVDSFCAYVQLLTDRLNGHGYALQCPARDRLETLITKATRG